MGAHRVGPAGISIPERVGDASEINYASPTGADYTLLARDRMKLRTIAQSDLGALTAIDRRITGRDRSAYFERKLAEALHESDVRVSLLAEQDGRPVGFIMARVDFGEFGRMEPAAVMDTIGIDPDFRRQGIARALMSQLLVNLVTLRVECIRTELDWRDSGLLAFLDRCGFRPAQQLCVVHAIEKSGGAGR
jgi:ribosomal protein S18 acetylase RimI-like enzyme